MVNFLEVLVDLFKINQGAKEQYLVEQLTLRGVDKVKAEKYIIFVPIAFGRFHLTIRYNDLEFNDFYYENGCLEEILLSEDEIYKWAYNLAKKNQEKSFLTEQEYLAVILRSPEIKNIVEALRLKKEIDGAKFRTAINIGLEMSE